MTTFPKGPDIPAGVYFVNCIEYSDRVADLARDNPSGPIIGFHNQNGSNQKWTFHPHHDRVFRHWKISTTTSNGEVCYARTNRTEGEVVFCIPDESQGTLYGVESVTGGFFRIYDNAVSDTKLFWTLSDEAEETQVKIQSGSGGNDRVWSFTLTEA